MNRDDVFRVVFDTMWMDYPYDGRTSCERVAGKITDAVLAALPQAGTGTKARSTDPATAHEASRLVKARSGTARIRLLEAFRNGADVEYGLTDEEAALLAGISLTSEYATRCSELRAMGVIEFTGNVRRSRSGMDRATSILTDLGQSVLLARAIREAS